MFLVLLLFIPTFCYIKAETSQWEHTNNTIQPLINFINKDISLEQLLSEVAEEVKKGSGIGHTMKSFLSYSGVGESENIFLALIHQSLSQDPVSLMALNYRHMMGFNTPESKLLATYGFREIYQLLKHNISMFDYVDLSSLVFNEKKDFKNVKSVLFPSSSLSTLIVDMEENFNYEKALKIFNEIIFADTNGFYKQHLYSIIETLSIRGYSQQAKLYSNLMQLKYSSIEYWLNNKDLLSDIRNFSLNLAIKGDVVASTIYAVTSYYLEDRNSTIMDTAFEYLLHAYNSKYKFSYFYMGLFYVERIGFLNASDEKSLHILKETAAIGCLNSLAYLAEMNNAGIGIFSDSESAAELYHLSLLHIIGKPFKMKSYEAIYNKKYTQALLNMLVLHYMGDEKQGYNIATLFRSGFITEIPNEKQKRLNFRFLKRATDIGSKEAWVKLANCYFYGNGVKKNYSDAFLAYTKAFSNKDYVGAYNLGYMYQYGFGVDRDIEMAKYYYQETINLEPSAEIPIYILSWRTRLDSMIIMLTQEFKNFISMNLTGKSNNLQAILRGVSMIDFIAVTYTVLTVVTILVVWKHRIKF